MACHRIANSLQMIYPFFLLFIDVTVSSSEPTSNLAKISEWAFKWKMTFNPDTSKPTQEVIFSRKIKTVPHPLITFNSNP